MSNDADRIAMIVRDRYDTHIRRDSQGARISSATTIVLEDLAIEIAAYFKEQDPDFDTRRFHILALGHIDAHLSLLEREGL